LDYTTIRDEGYREKGGLLSFQELSGFPFPALGGWPEMLETGYQIDRDKPISPTSTNIAKAWRNALGVKRCMSEKKINGS